MKTKIEEYLLSIVVPMYNVESYIGRCLDSLLTQDIENYEIIIVNDGSTDKSLNIAREYQQKSKKIKILEQKNQGQSVARNKGLEEAVGKYIFFVDSDDYITENSLSKLLNQISENNLDLLGFEYCIDVNDQVEFRDVSKTQYGFIQTSGEFITNGLSMLPVWFVIIKREVLIKNNLRFLPGSTHEDNYMMPQIIFSCRRLMMSPLCIYFYVKRPNSTLSTTNTDKIKKYCLDMFPLAISLNNFYKNQNITANEREYIFQRQINNALAYAFGRIIYKYIEVDYKNIIKIRHELRKEGLLPIQKKESFRIPSFLLAIFNNDFLFNLAYKTSILKFKRKIQGK